MLNQLLNNKKRYILICGILFFIFWLISFLGFHFSIKKEILIAIEGIQLLFIAISAFLLLYFIEDTFYVIPLFTFCPFVFAHPFDALTTPVFLYIALLIAAIGIIIHFIKFKVKLIKGKLFLGILILGISFIFGGICVSENDDRLLQLIFCLFICLAFVIAYMFFISSVYKPSFDIIATLMNVLSLILILQISTDYLLELNFSQKILNVGWGISNNIALMLLFTMPFSFYFSIQTTYKCKIRYFYLLYTILQYSFIIFTYSRGCIIFGGAMLVAMFFIGLKYFKDHLRSYLGLYLIMFVSFIMTILILSLSIDGFFKDFIKMIIHSIDFSTGNGRYKIYKELFIASLKHPIFGHGMLYPFVSNPSNEIISYKWGHCTLIHTFYTLGGIGLLAMLYHLFEKYYSVIKNINKEKMILLLSYLFSGLYGMIDISYFFINYMVVLFVIFVLTDNYVESFKEDKLNDFKLHK